jgi:NAD(P)-dependent dehydrogenase (short-subunit alcohol dehydrogenase family)
MRKREIAVQEKPVALVTGANKGIGLQIGKDLTAQGFIVLVGSRSLDHGEAAAKSIGADARALQLDVTNQASIAAAAERIRNEFGRLDVLVNNAAISHAGKPGRPLEEMAKSGRLSLVSLDEVRAVFETNVFGVIAVTQAMLPLLREAPAGRIVNVSSASGSLTLNSDPKNPHPFDVRHLLFIEDGAQRDHARLRPGPGVDRHQGERCVSGLYCDGPQKLRGHADGQTGRA